jgi:hypothetical protein
MRQVNSYENLDPNQTPFYNQWKESVLTKARVYGLPSYTIENSSVKTIYDILKAHETEQIELSRRTAEIAIVDTSADNDNFIGEYERELIAKAVEYGISFDPNFFKIDWLKLIDAIHEREILIDEAREFGVRYDLYKDDIIGLEQALEEARENERSYAKDLCRYYNSTRI